MEENNIFVAGDDALVYLNVPVHKKYSTTLVWGHPFSTYVSQEQFFPLSFPLPCKHMHAFRLTVSAVGLFQKIILIILISYLLKYKHSKKKLFMILQYEINTPGSSINKKPNSSISVMLCTGVSIVKKNFCLVARIVSFDTVKQ